jgi:hypothetical protein
MAQDIPDSSERPTVCGNDPKRSFFFCPVAPSNQELPAIGINVFQKRLWERSGDVADGTAIDTHPGKLKLAVGILAEVEVSAIGCYLFLEQIVA